MTDNIDSVGEATEAAELSHLLETSLKVRVTSPSASSEDGGKNRTDSGCSCEEVAKTKTNLGSGHSTDSGHGSTEVDEGMHPEQKTSSRVSTDCHLNFHA